MTRKTATIWRALSSLHPPTHSAGSNKRQSLPYLNGGGPGANENSPLKKRGKNICGADLNNCISVLSLIVYDSPDVKGHILAVVNTIVKRESGLGPDAPLILEHAERICLWKTKVQQFFRDSKVFALAHTCTCCCTPALAHSTHRTHTHPHWHQQGKQVKKYLEAQKALNVPRETAFAAAKAGAYMN